MDLCFGSMRTRQSYCSFHLACPAVPHVVTNKLFVVIFRFFPPSLTLVLYFFKFYICIFTLYIFIIFINGNNNRFTSSRICAIVNALYPLINYCIVSEVYPTLTLNLNLTLIIYIYIYIYIYISIYNMLGITCNNNMMLGSYLVMFL